MGLEQAGFLPVYVNELNVDAMESYLMNRREHFPHLDKYKSYDIKEAIKDDSIFDELAKKDIDLVCGGPPCQGFSRIGIRRSYSVEKKHLPSNHLFEDMAEFIRRVKPKVLFLRMLKVCLNQNGLLAALEEKYSTIFYGPSGTKQKGMMLDSSCFMQKITVFLKDVLESL